MTLEQDLLKLEGEIYPIEVRLNAADGAVDTKNYEVYGAAEAGRTRHTFAVQTTDKPGVYHVEIPALSFTKNPYWDYQICARRKTTGHEWLLLQGQIKLRYRIADVPAVKVGAPQQTFTATISADSLTVDVHEIAGVKGDRGYSAYDVACQNGFEGTEKEWLESLKHDAAQEAIETVRPYADSAERNADAAHESAQQAALSASNASQSAADAQEALNNSLISEEVVVEAKKNAENAAKQAAESESNAADHLAAVKTLSEEVTDNKEHVDSKAAEVTANAQEAAKQADAAANSALNASADANNAAGSAGAAKQSEKNALDGATRAESAAYNADLSKQAAAASETKALKAQQAALISQEAAEQSANTAEEAKADSESAALNAHNSEVEAKASADAAAADKTAAEKAKHDAQAAQSKAEQEAQKAADNAALLGDAALQSGDNEFSGCNVFAGESVGVLPGDFMKFSWVDSAETLKTVCPDLGTRKSWYFYTPKLLMNYGFNGGGTGAKASVFEDVVFYSEVVSPSGYYNLLGVNKANMRRLVLVLPEYKGHITPVSNNLVGGEFNIEKCEIYAPKATCYGFRRARVASLLMVCANTEINESVFDVSSCIYSLRRVSFPGKVINRVVMTKLKRLREVLTDFPLATVINFQNAELDKASVLRIVNGLQTYDSATMETVPDLTIGIDPTLDGDEEINAALLNAQAAVEDGGKGWNVAVNGFTITAGGATTEGLTPHIYARHWQDDAGGYVDADGTRWAVRWGNTVLENWVANEQLGYVEFATLDDALTAWGLTEYIAPETQEEEQQEE